MFHDWDDHGGKRPISPELRQQKARSESAASVVLFIYVVVLVGILVLWRTVRSWFGGYRRG